jgi:hypothetical protein
MLSVETPFPNVGAKALLIDQHQAHPVRILQNGVGRGKRREVLVSLIGREGSSANRRVTVADLADPSPLTEAEQEELRELERQLAGKTSAPKKVLKREEELRLRAVHHARLEEEERRRKFNFGGYRPRGRG